MEGTPTINEEDSILSGSDVEDPILTDYEDSSDNEGKIEKSKKRKRVHDDCISMEMTIPNTPAHERIELPPSGGVMLVRPITQEEYQKFVNNSPSIFRSFAESLVVTYKEKESKILGEIWKHTEELRKIKNIITDMGESMVCDVCNVRKEKKEVMTCDQRNCASKVCCRCIMERNENNPYCRAINECFKCAKSVYVFQNPDQFE